MSVKVFVTSGKIYIFEMVTVTKPNFNTVFTFVDFRLFYFHFCFGPTSLALQRYTEGGLSLVT